MTKPAILNLTIMGHAVQSHFPAAPGSMEEMWNRWGLSHMQRKLLSDTPWIRVVDAPTGSGKSYAFQKAVLPGPDGARGKDVLFVSPTRRLTESLASDLRQGLLRDAEDLAASKGVEGEEWKNEVEDAVLLWNSQQETPTNLGRNVYRKRALRGGCFRSRPLGIGRTIFTVMEIVRDLVFPPAPEKGHNDDRSVAWVSRFRHVVFDEFHTLGPDGIALAVVLTAMVQHINLEKERRARLRGTHPKYTYLTFLSATPFDLSAFLQKALASGNPERLPERSPEETGNGICMVSEQLISSSSKEWPWTEDKHSASAAAFRPLHGDVEMEVREAESMRELVKLYLPEIMDEIKEGRQVVFIWDSKGRLKQEEADVKSAILSGMNGVNINILTVNASDDRASGEGLCHMEMKAADVLLATSSVEAGVTFRGNRLLFMEPGFDVVNFVQRFGRCARGASDGQPIAGKVVVRLDRNWQSSWRVWVPRVFRGISSTSARPSSMDVVDFRHSLLRLAYSPSDPASSLSCGFFSSKGYGRQALFRAWLFWAAAWLLLERYGRQGADIQSIGTPPKQVLWMRDVITKVSCLRQKSWWKRPVGPTRREIMAADSWIAGWMATALSLRDIVAPSYIFDIDPVTRVRRSRPFELSWLHQYTRVLDFCSLDPPLNQVARFMEKGGIPRGALVLWLDRGCVEDYMLEEKRKRPDSRYSMPGGGEEACNNDYSAARRSADELRALSRCLITRKGRAEGCGTGKVALDKLASVVRATGRPLRAGEHHPGEMDTILVHLQESSVI